MSDDPSSVLSLTNNIDVKVSVSPKTKSSDVILTKMKQFVVEAVEGSLMAYIRLNMKIEPVMMCLNFLKIYLNDSWHKCHLRTDDKIVKTFDEFLLLDKIKDVSNMFYLIYYAGNEILEMLNLQKAVEELKDKNIERQRGEVRMNVEYAYDLLVFSDPDSRDDFLQNDSFIRTYDGGNLFDNVLPID